MGSIIGNVIDWELCVLIVVYQCHEDYGQDGEEFDGYSSNEWPIAGPGVQYIDIHQNEK